jgi:hypothetical protein
VKTSASIFFLILSFLTVQPLLSSTKTVEKKHCCLKKTMDCLTNKQKSKNTGQCDNNRCNPFMACVSGNFYVVANGPVVSYAALLQKAEIDTVNDNRLASCLSDCWHPPEINIV